MSDPWLPRSEHEVVEGFVAACDSYKSPKSTRVVVRQWGERIDILRYGAMHLRVDARFQRGPHEVSPKFPYGKLPRFTVKLYGDRWMNLDFHRASGKGWRFDWGREGRLAGGTPPLHLVKLAEDSLDAMPSERTLDDKALLDAIWMPLLLRGPREV